LDGRCNASCTFVEAAVAAGIGVEVMVLAESGADSNYIDLKQR